jgi:catechol 2,3-dioxygenase-like lactoylglutathione lyase family enzyme
MIKKIRHTGIVVRNLDESYDFYHNLGFTLVSDEIESNNFIDTILGLDDCRIRIMKMSCGDEMIELLDYKNPISYDPIKKINSIGCSHLALTVDNLREVYDDLQNRGTEFISPPSSSGKVLVAFCKDPNDVYLELVEEL